MLSSLPRKITVKDTGIGIPIDFHRVFRLFSQVDSSSRREYGGSGLGLALSKKLAEIIGGDITYDSVEGKGSNFYFTFTSKGRSSTLPMSTAVFRSKKALIVVDKNLTCQSLKMELERYGFVVETAISVDTTLSGRSADYVFVDFRLVRDFKTVESLKSALPKKSHIVLLSAFGDWINEDLTGDHEIPILLLPFQRRRLLKTLNSFDPAHVS
ncbi:unnamed protein product [Ambrosiozyma monospora]|uniref:Unnamed protein product n=1 Tax=Ambrosiozyma monospora TaxID=43982 RepID=A0ACB5UBG0_AMBMO|nr:unnamed protein product [Ambrosiozyma monospora]